MIKKHANSTFCISLPLLPAQIIKATVNPIIKLFRIVSLTTLLPLLASNFVSKYLTFSNFKIYSQPHRHITTIAEFIVSNHSILLTFSSLSLKITISPKNKICIPTHKTHKIIFFNCFFKTNFSSCNNKYDTKTLSFSELLLVSHQEITGTKRYTTICIIRKIPSILSIFKIYFPLYSF